MSDVELYNHYNDFPMWKWRWENFTPSEIASRTVINGQRGPKGPLLVHYRSLDMLQELRDRLGKPMRINSAYRSPEYNRFVGGASRSMHMKGQAFDVDMSNHDRDLFVSTAKEVGFKGIGYYNSFIHIDSRENPAEWYG